MGLTGIPSSERVHIAFFGKRNAGKSSLVNAVTGQEMSIVSDIRGTTTDPVKKTMEILPLGPVVIIDTPGFDDEGMLGEKRVHKTNEILEKTDIAILVVEGSEGLSEDDREFIKAVEKKGLPYVVAYTKMDICKRQFKTKKGEIKTSTINNTGIEELKEAIAGIRDSKATEKYIVKDLFEKGDIVVFVIPVDLSAPKGRFILPQQLTLREVLDFNGMAVCCQTEELEDLLAKLVVLPKLVITDSKDFERVAAIVPENIPITSFSLLFARYKGTLAKLISDVGAVDNIKDGDKILIAEGCTHHRQCEDIGTKRIPEWIEKYTGKKPVYTFSSGAGFPENILDFSMIIHCGGCMLNEKEMKNRIDMAEESSIPIINYGAMIAKVHGIFDRAIAVLDN